jgi:short subunit dehydrogenase-like uncharacterized protein
MNDKKSRPFDIILFGATGFTGRLVAEYLLAHYSTGQPNITWAIAGRSREKLSALRDDLTRINPNAKNIEILIADSNDINALNTLVQKARVICTTVGPYSQYGTPLVAACANYGTHYCDLTGEAPWIRQNIDSFHAIAEQNGARIVHCCGFDSIPSDLGCFVVQEFAKEKFGAPCDDVAMYVERAKGGASGGTAASMVDIMSNIKDKEYRKLLLNPYSLDPDPNRSGPDGADQMAIKWDKKLEQWTGPFIMATINARIVRRSNALLGYSYGEGFRYREVMGFGKTLKGLGIATAVGVGLGALSAGLALAPTRKLLSKYVLPKPGEGPSRETIKNGYFRIKFVGEITSKNQRVLGTVIGVSDPGYGETAKMISESAVCLATQSDELTGPKGGILTPASALGMTLVKRLRDAGMTFDAS